jgi:hypothetical protein
MLISKLSGTYPKRMYNVILILLILFEDGGADPSPYCPLLEL